MPSTEHPFEKSDRLAGIELSQIVQISEIARQLRAAGKDVIALSTGEPDFPTPLHIIQAAHTAAKDGQTKYTPTPGTSQLRSAIADMGGAEPQNTIVSTGAKQVIANAMLATLNPGDEVIMPAPFWTSYADVVLFCAGSAVRIPCPMDQGFKLSPEALEKAITPRTRWLMLNSPSNPSGAIYTREEIMALAAVLKRHSHVWVLADEIYEHLNYVPFTSFVDAAPELKGRVLIVNGVSKAWSMTGWRIGWGIGPTPLIKAMTAVQGQITSGTCSMAQAAALTAITGDNALLEQRRRSFKARRDLVVSGLNAIPGINCPLPDGAFYAFPSCADLLIKNGGPFVSDAEFCAWLMDEASVAVVPGGAFGLDDHFRLSFAYAQGLLSEAITRMTHAISEKTNGSR